MLRMRLSSLATVSSGTRRSDVSHSQARQHLAGFRIRPSSLMHSAAEHLSRPGRGKACFSARLHRYGLRPPRNDIQVLMSRVRPGYLPIFIELAKSRLPTDSAHGSEDIAEALAATWKAIPTHDSRGERTNETQPMPIDVALHRWMAQAGR